MRHVDIAKLIPPNTWPGRAQVATAAVAAGADPDDHSNVWRELKNKLAQQLHDKCWYCETPVSRSDNAVDHFRPKGRVSDAAQPHQGYRWLAFDLRNFRYACTFCNSRRKDVEGGTAGGKADRFPLVDESKRVYVEGPVTQERPMLLDPCNLLDAQLLGCEQESGRPCAATQDLISIKRVEMSIEIYHLHHTHTCIQRHGVVLQLKEDIDEAKSLFSRMTLGQDEERSFEKALLRIKRAIDLDARFSGDMRFILKGCRSDEHPWIQNLLDA